MILNWYRKHDFRRYDFLYVYDGANEFGTQLAQLDGDSIPNPIESTGRDMFLNFLSDDSETRAGFQIQFEAGKLFVLSFDRIWVTIAKEYDFHTQKIRMINQNWSFQL